MTFNLACNDYAKYFLALLLLCSGNITASVEDYLYLNSSPSFSSYGTTGLIQMPSARLQEEGSIGVNFSTFYPYQRLSLIAYPFSFLEIQYQYTDIKNKLYSEVKAFSGNQTYKDKGFDIKFNLLDESHYLPQIAVGFRDIGGTALFASEFLVASKKISNIDMTIGMGWGNLDDGSTKNPISAISPSVKTRPGYAGGQGGEFAFDTFFRGETVGIFGGIEIFIPHIKGLRFKVERDSTNYFREGFAALPQESKYNLGLTYAVSKQLKLSAGYIRGNEMQFGFSLSANYGKKNPLIAKTDKPKVINRANVIRRVNAQDDRYLYLTALKYLKESRFSLRTANIQDNVLEVSYSQNVHASYPRSYGRISNILHQIAPDSIDVFRLISMNANYELATIDIPRDSYVKNAHNQDYQTLYRDIVISQQEPDKISQHAFKPESKFPALFYSLSPALQSHIGGPEKFFVGGLHIRADSEILFRRNLSLQSVLRLGLTDSFTTLTQPSYSVLPHVRSDVVEYLQGGNNFSITRMQFNYFENPFKSIYTRLSYGIFEEMFGGYGGEILYRPFERNWAIGIEAYQVKQRGYDQMFSYQTYQTKTGHATFYYREPRSKVLLSVTGGRFLAQDSGFTFDVSRRFKSGLNLGAFFSLTDISKEEFGEGSFDKGIYLNFPIEAFFKNYSRGLSNFGLRPLTRDGAAKLVVGHSLWGVTDEGQRNSIARDWNDLYD